MNRNVPQLVDRFGQPMAMSLSFGGIYEGAKYSRQRGLIPDASGDSRQNLDPWTRIQLLSAARWLYANVGFVKGSVRDIARYSVGTGIIPQSQIAEPEVRQGYEAYWREWCKVPEVTGKWTYSDVLRLGSMAIDVDGDFGRIYTETPDGFPQLQLVEAHRIGGNSNREGWVDGVKVNALDRPVSFQVIGSAKQPTPVDSYNFGLVCDPDRMDETRGKSGLHHAVNNLRDVLEILAAEKMGVKINSLLALIIKGVQDVGNGFFGKTTQTGDAAGGLQTLEQLFAGAIPRLNPGEDIFAHTSDRPSSSFQGFLDYLCRDVAVGLGVPVEFVWNAEKMGGAGNRFVLVKADRKFRERQATLIRMCTRDWGYVIGKAVKRGDLPFHKDWWRVIWQTPARATVDVGREAQQNREDLRSGSRTLAEDASERGVDWEDLREQREREAADLIDRAQRLASQKKIDFLVALQLLQNQSQVGQPASPNTTTEPATT